MRCVRQPGVECTYVLLGISHTCVCGQVFGRVVAHVRNLFRKVAILDAEARLKDTDESGEGLVSGSMGEPTPMDEAELLDASIDNDIEMKN